MKNVWILGVHVLRFHWIVGDATILELWRLTLGCEGVHQDFVAMPQNKKVFAKNIQEKKDMQLIKKCMRVSYKSYTCLPWG